MIDYRNKSVLVLGLGRFGGGVGVARYLAENGAKVRVSDLLKKDDLSQSIQQLSEYSIDYRLGGHNVQDLESIDLVVVNSAIPPTNSFLKEIGKKNIPITTEVNIFFENCPAKIIAVIGTNGKETVVRLIDNILTKAKINHFVGGNIGLSLLGELEKMNSGDYVIFEISSFQLHRLRLIKRRPDIVVLTNIQADHLDWHGNMSSYIDDKLVALQGQGKDGFAIINCDNQFLEENLDKVEGKLIKTRLKDMDEGVFVKNGLIIAKFSEGEEVLSTTRLSVPGQHNIENALSASAVGYVLGLHREIIEPALISYTGVENALELVGRKDGIVFYNDSEATNPDATIAGLNSFNKPIWLIAGGFNKKIDYTPLVKVIAEKVVGLATIGQLTDSLANEVSQMNRSVTVFKAETLQKAYNWIMSKIGDDGVILLSPGSSSYDQYKNLEQRGEEFRDLVKKDLNAS